MAFKEELQQALSNLPIQLPENVVTEENISSKVVTSINGNKGNITPEQTGCLPLNGGNVSGDINMSSKETNTLRFKNGLIKSNTVTDNTFRELLLAADVFGTDEKGALLSLHTSKSTREGGAVALISRLNNGDLGPALSISPNGNITFDGNKSIPALLCNRVIEAKSINPGQTLTFTIPFERVRRVTKRIAISAVRYTSGGDWAPDEVNFTNVTNTQITMYLFHGGPSATGDIKYLVTIFEV